eukprot:1768067-Amphidinium_carterae.1
MTPDVLNVDEHIGQDDALKHQAQLCKGKNSTIPRSPKVERSPLVTCSPHDQAAPSPESKLQEIAAVRAVFGAPTRSVLDEQEDATP